MAEHKYMISQRVIYGNVICVITRVKTDNTEFDYYIDNPEKGYVHGVSADNLKPLPNGQL